MSITYNIDAFRQDLLYRLNTIEIQLPALRERLEDIPLLADHFIRLYATKYHKDIRKASEPLIKSAPERSEESVSLDHLNIEDVERILIRKALEKHHGHITNAAQELGLTRSSLYRRLEKYGL